VPNQNETGFDVYEKLGFSYLTQLQNSIMQVRSMEMEMVRGLGFEKDELQLLDLVNRIYTAIELLLTQEIKPLCLNRNQWDDFQEEVQAGLRERGIVKPLDPNADDYFQRFLTWTNVIMGTIVRYLENFGMLLTPMPPAQDVVGDAWRAITDETRTNFLKRLRFEEQARRSESSKVEG